MKDMQTKFWKILPNYPPKILYQSTLLLIVKFLWGSYHMPGVMLEDNDMYLHSENTKNN